ncbi:MAG: SDR family oxidoreductase [Acidimicrobiales bacterium]
MAEPLSPLGGQVAVVTGGGSGIGRAIAVSLARRGVRCVLAGRRASMLSETLAMLDVPGTSVVADVTDAGDRRSIVDHVLHSLGRIDLLVHAAGVFEKRPVDQTDDEFWNRITDVNVAAVMALSRSAWPALSATSGQIVLISSIAATEAFEGDAAYAASKGALEALGRVLALEGRPHGIRVITVAPGQTDTAIWGDEAPPEVRARMMPASGVGELIASLVAADRRIAMSPLAIRPTNDPWSVEDHGPAAPDPRS